MDFEKIYQECLELFPEEINISDGHVIPEVEGFLSMNLNNVFDNADNVLSQISDWHNLVSWVISQVLHIKARKAFMANKFVINKGIDRKDFRRLLMMNLEQEDYEIECQEFFAFEKEHGSIAP